MEQEKRIRKLKEDIEKRITSECEIIKKAANPRKELTQYIRNIGWTSPEMAALVRKIALNALDLND